MGMWTSQINFRSDYDLQFPRYVVFYFVVVLTLVSTPQSLGLASVSILGLGLGGLDYQTNTCVCLRHKERRL